MIHSLKNDAKERQKKSVIVSLSEGGFHSSELNHQTIPVVTFSLVFVLHFPLYNIIIWPCLQWTGNKQIQEFDWLKSILTAV